MIQGHGILFVECNFFNKLPRKCHTENVYCLSFLLGTKWDVEFHSVCLLKERRKKWPINRRQTDTLEVSNMQVAENCINFLHIFISLPIFLHIFISLPIFLQKNPWKIGVLYFYSQPPPLEEGRCQWWVSNTCSFVLFGILSLKTCPPGCLNDTNVH